MKWAYDFINEVWHNRVVNSIVNSEDLIGHTEYLTL
jgi:hypothetical protein